MAGNGRSFVANQPAIVSFKSDQVTDLTVKSDLEISSPSTLTPDRIRLLLDAYPENESHPEITSDYRCYITCDDGIVNIHKNNFVARKGSRVNALGGTIIAEHRADVRGAIGSHIEFLPGSTGIVEVGTDIKLWTGATVRVVSDITPFLHTPE